MRLLPRRLLKTHPDEPCANRQTAIPGTIDPPLLLKLGERPDILRCDSCAFARAFA
jgi:hypothetical protein